MVFEEVVLIRDVYLGCSGDRRSMPTKFGMALNTSERIDYSNRALKDDSAEILALKGNESCKQLNLGDNSDLTNEKLNEILGTMVNLEFLCLKGLPKLTDISFINNVKKLRELDLLQTSVTDLSILEENALNLDSLCIDNANIDLTNIQKTISRLTFKYGVGEAWGGNFFGLKISNSTLYKKLEQCTEITSYERYLCGSINTDLDLSNCTKLVSIKSSWSNSHIKVPKNCEKIWLDNEFDPDLSEAESLISFECSAITWTSQTIDKVMNELKNCHSLEKIIFNFGTNSTPEEISFTSFIPIETFQITMHASKVRKWKVC